MGPLLKKPVRDILFVTVGYTLGGSENMIARIAPRLKNRGYKIRVLAFKNWGPVSEAIKKLGIECIALQGKGKFDLRVLWRYFIYLKKAPPDLIIAFLYRAYIPSRIFASLLSIPNISSVQGVWGWMNTFQRALDRITAPLDYVTYSCSKSVTNFLVKIVGHKEKQIVTIKNGIDIDFCTKKIDKRKKLEELSLPPNTKIIGTVSRLHEPTKGISILLKAYKKIQNKRDSRLLIVGSGKDEKMLTKMAKELDIKVSFLGERKDISEILQIIDIFVLSSFYEGLPVSLLEAMAMKIPVVATNVGDNPEVVINGKTGFLVEPGNPDLLAEKIEFFLTNEETSKDFGKEGFKRVKENFSIEQTVTEIENLWKGDFK